LIKWEKFAAVETLTGEFAASTGVVRRFRVSVRFDEFYCSIVVVVITRLRV
jgi:hypothetical protein